MINKNKKDLSVALADYLINANVCKNDRCDNFAVNDAKEYVSPSHYLGFPALHCSRCGSNALLLSNEDINRILLPKIDFYLTKITKACPNCYSLKSISYGKTQQHTLRRQCKVCQTVYNDDSCLTQQQLQQQKKLILLCQLLFADNGLDFKTIIAELGISYSYFYHLLQQLEYIIAKNSLMIFKQKLWKKVYHISTQSLIVPAKNNVSLWGITSVLSDSGYVLLNSLNYTEQVISLQSRYNGKNTQILSSESKLSDIDQILLKYDRFFERKSFDLLIYHSLPFTTDKYTLVEPVVCAYVHFHALRQFYHGLRTNHYLEHEIVLRSAAMTSYSQAIKHNHCAIYYLHELQPANADILSIAKYKVGWWSNPWYELKNAQHKTCRFMGLLTSKNKVSESEIASLPASFQMNERFYTRFYQYFPAAKLRKLSPKYLIQLLNIFTGFYNFCLLDAEQETPAQKAGITIKPLSIEELIKYPVSL
ncbi:hypothetical protein A9G11_10180 [Gilliamella sp. wkB108]|uniref:helix-turn-helix domain-containing protein n=1 Tax=Gilliamella sp. wkB108 TaxID=3120256 RepID=UPI00080E72DC|nr:helix-turn-helix domain-containing protein [Gilliamella apicola]OCG28586.1 hypothetical protein A9G11_10180 [Gilliamella apicola]